PIPIPVPILRLPWGPEGCSRGFDPSSPRCQARKEDQEREEEAEAATQRARASLRQRYLQVLAGAQEQPCCFCLWGKLQLEAVLAAADVHAAAALQVDSLHTPLGVEAAALLRCADLIAFSF
ncbi:GEMI7 protein, partial [Bucco capensis]|nr:GEMI7 protein [Bucco capensis]